MAIHLHIQNSAQIVVPIRFERAGRGIPRSTVPELDDRGYAMPRPGGWVTTNARGPMVGIRTGRTVRIRVRCEEIDWCAPLYATASQVANPQIEIVDPAPGTPIPINRARRSGVIQVRAVSSRGDGQTVQIRLGAVDGPIIGELEPHVFRTRTLNVTPHVCTIHRGGGSGGRTPRINGQLLSRRATMTRLFRIVRAIWEPAGVRINVGRTQLETLTDFGRDDFASRAEENRVVNTNQVPSTCNVYFIRYMDSSIGVGVNRDSMAGEGWTAPGLIVAAEGSLATPQSNPSPRSSRGNMLFHEVAATTAHEIGHFLSLQHAGNRHASNPLLDTYARRQLMYPVSFVPRRTDGRPNDVGYGTVSGGIGYRGCLLTMKDHATHSTDSDVENARARFQSQNLY